MFSKREALRFGWNTFKAHWLFLLVVVLLANFISFAPGFFLQWVSEDFFWVKWMVNIVFWVLGAVFTIGLFRVLLLFLAGKKPEYADLLRESKLLLSYWVASFLYGLLIFVGLILLIVPGIIVTVRLQFWTYVMVNKQCGPVAALKESWRITGGSVINIMLFNLLTVAVVFLGVLAFGVGVFVAIPVTLLATTFVYGKLQTPQV
jgi:uncharacterized membrane protein